MKYTGPYVYSLFLSFENEIVKLVRKERDGQVCNFQLPVTKDKFPKLYIIKTLEGDVAYVGYTGQSITNRLYYGFKANGKTGYHGYKWAKKLKEAQLLVFVFDKQLTGDRKKDEADVAFVEGVEAELVYLIRHETGQWPIYQNEIHFNNLRHLETKNMGSRIFEIITARN